MSGYNKDFEECLQQKFACRQGVVVLPVTGLKIVHMLDSPAFSTLMLLSACGGTCESAITAVARRCSVAIQYNGLAIFVKSRDLLCRAVELCCGDLPQLLLQYFCKIRIHFYPTTQSVWTEWPWSQECFFNAQEVAMAVCSELKCYLGWKKWPPVIHDSTSMRLQTTGASILLPLTSTSMDPDAFPVNLQAVISVSSNRLMCGNL